MHPNLRQTIDGLMRKVGNRLGLSDFTPSCCRQPPPPSLATTARQFADGIRGHWGIENRLHWLKDVVFKEDACLLKRAHAPQNRGLIRIWAINLFRLHGEGSINKA